MRTFNWGLVCGMLLAFGILEFPEIRRGCRGFDVVHRDVGTFCYDEELGVTIRDRDNKLVFVGVFPTEDQVIIRSPEHPLRVDRAEDHDLWD